MDWTELSTENCSVRRGLDLLAKPWALLVVRDLFQGLRRFEDLQHRLGVSRPVLTARLRELEEGGVVERRPYRLAGQRTRYEYRLTERGLDLNIVLSAVREWGDRHLVDSDGPATELRHRECGELVHTELRCAAGHHGLRPRDVRSYPGPGARPLAATAPATAE